MCNMSILWVYGLNMHVRETVHFCGVIDRESITVVSRTN